MDERIEPFDPETLPPDKRTWFYEERERARVGFTPIPRLTNQPVQAPLAPLILPETLLAPAPLGGSLPSPAKLLRTGVDLGPIQGVCELRRETNLHHLLPPNLLKEWWEADSLTRSMIMREAGIE